MRRWPTRALKAQLTRKIVPQPAAAHRPCPARGHPGWAWYRRGNV